MFRLTLRLFASLIVLLSFVPLARAGEEAKVLGTFRSWTAYQYAENGKSVCFMASKPTSSLPAGSRRGEIYVMVTHRPGENQNSVVSVVNGYSFRPNSEVAMTIGRQNFALFTQGDTAWARDGAADKAIMQAIKGGSTMTVVGTSARGTKTTDSYSLAGTGAALEAINKACGVR
jgi:hypothetical protein